MIKKGNTGAQDLRVKYRPRQFRHLVQGLSDPVIQSITLPLSQGRRLQHLGLRGPFGSGKTSLARLLGQRAVCNNQHLHPYEPCGKCSGCQAAWENPLGSDWGGYSEFDVQSASPRDMIKRIKSEVMYRKEGGKIMPQRVVTLDEFHRLPIKDQEKFVKVIEDYGARFCTLFIICVAEDAKICPAISQRCTPRRIVLPSLARSRFHIRAIARAEGYILTPDDAELLAATARRVPRVYLGLLQDAIVFSHGETTVTRQAVTLACDLLSGGHAETWQ